MGRGRLALGRRVVAEALEEVGWKLGEDILGDVESVKAVHRVVGMAHAAISGGQGFEEGEKGEALGPLATGGVGDELGAALFAAGIALVAPTDVAVEGELDGEAEERSRRADVIGPQIVALDGLEVATALIIMDDFEKGQDILGVRGGFGHQPSLRRITGAAEFTPGVGAVTEYSPEVRWGQGHEGALTFAE
jgi:hypothetical protein